MDEIEYDCPDCGLHIIAFGFYGVAAPGKRCASCDWIRENVPPEHHTLMRERLGCPLAAVTEPPEAA